MKKWFKTLNRKNSDSIKWDWAQEECQGTDCYLFSIADSDYETAPSVKEAMINRVKHGAFGYVNKGKDYETIVQQWYEKRYHVDISKASIINTPSVLNSIAVVIDTLTNQDDGIIIQTPVYHKFKEVIEHNHRQVIDNTLTLFDQNYTIDFDLLEEQFKSGYRTLVFCNPHNPVGRVWNKEEVVKLIKLAKKYQVLIISDEIHGDIVMPGHAFVSLAGFFDLYENMIIISAPTKVFNIAGLQIANIIIENKKLRRKIKDAYDKLHLTRPNLMAMIALKAAYQAGESWLEAQNKHIYNNYLYMKNVLESYDYFEVFPLEGTYLAWIKVALPDRNPKQFVEELKSQGVFISPGFKFDHGEDFIRASLACSKEQLEKGLKELSQYLNKLYK